MTAFTNIDASTSPEDAAAQIYAAIQQRWADWEPSDANLETWLADAFARLASETAALSAQTTLAIFRNFGLRILGVPPLLAVGARGELTVEVGNDDGWTIPEGAEFSLQRTGSERYGFVVTSAVEIPPGATETAEGEVPIQALIPGVDANGLTPADSSPTMISALDIPIVSVELVDATSGGQNEESETEYLDRLVDEISLLAPTPILPADFTKFVLRNPAVYRAVTIDGWNRGSPGTIDNERMVGSVAIDEAGEDVDADIKTDIEADIAARREVNFDFGMGSPTYTTIFVTVDVVMLDGYDAATVEQSVEDALRSYLSPVNWGNTPGGDTERTWLNSTVVRYTELVSVVDRVPGVDYVDTLSLDDATAPSSDADVTLSGRVPLTRAATTGTGITVNAT